MLSKIRHLIPQQTLRSQLCRTLATAAQHTPRERGPRAEGDISSVFASLSGTEATPLPDRFATAKQDLIQGHELAIIASWTRLLSDLRNEVETISSTGSAIIPEIEFSEIHNHSRIHGFARGLKKRGAAIVRGVVSEDEALSWKEEIREYIRHNPTTKAFPKDNPAVYELYWSPGQIKARANPNLLETQKFLLSFWHSKDKDAAIDINTPVAYADRVRIRMPGDAGFALGPHVDGGSAERWEKEGYGQGGVYDDIWRGEWKKFDPWELSSRLPVEADLYNGAGACSMIRSYQGWLSMSSTGAGQGTLLVNPLFKLATAYYLLRPFFSPRTTNVESSGYLDASNWALDPIQNSLVQGATLGMTQELSDALHPHLELEKSMVHVPDVRPGDYVAWHCDTIHSVDKVHNGTSDSSVMYIPACPLTETNAQYLIRQKEAFLNGTPGPDFPGGKGESEHVGRMSADDIEKAGGVEGLRAMGLRPWDENSEFLKRTNAILG